ncbi:hypothetical protein Ddye_002226 [Dipteronia dyeriana]|uniref:non-specific serine/threonine protein kinase n=1 Tax=Dipteronia dyeriana TaxID=168575 RepID=A0AAD9XQI4_9ROSI|nr:hypothetical protein Ddye_002226 [Dipteronia dyeriana]
MTQDSSLEQDQDDSSDVEFVEVDPTRRYGRYKEVLGRGAFKKVYRAFDELEGLEVAWNQIKVSDLLRNSEDLERLYSEVHLLKTLKHKNIIKFYNSWVDIKNDHINFITEIFTSGTLRQYRKKHKHVDLRAMKRWSRQILEGLSYLHGHDPPVIHRDLKCDNIFVNGNHGEVKIGDLGLAAILRQAQSAHSVIGTPEFMAPELYEEEYNELVDIYAFGMCLLELVTFEYPYCECSNAAQIYKKVTSGIKPASLAKVTDPGVRAFIEKCLAKASDRLPAKELMGDPFLQSVEENDSVGRSLRVKTHHSAGSSHQGISVENARDCPAETSRDFTLQGQRSGINTIFLKLRIADSAGHMRNIHFPFDIGADTEVAVAREMVEELNLTDQDLSTIAAKIDSEIRSHIPDWEPRETAGDSFGIKESSGHSSPETKDDASSLTSLSVPFSVKFQLERLPSGHKYWSDSPKGENENYGNKPGSSNLASTHLLDLTGNLINNKEQQPDSCWDADGPNGGASPEKLDSEQTIEEKEDGIPNLQFSDSNSAAIHGGNAAHQVEEKCKILMDYESENVKQTVEDLKHLLVQQQKEVDELKRKHELAISDLLEELSPEIRQKVLDICETTQQK